MPHGRIHDDMKMFYHATMQSILLRGRQLGNRREWLQRSHKVRLRDTSKDSNFVPNLTPYKSCPLLLSSLSIRYALCLHNDARTMLKRCRFGAFSPFRNDYWRKHFAPILYCIRFWSILHSETGRFKSRTGSTQTASPSRINSDRLGPWKKHKIKWNWNFYPFVG